MPVSSNVLVHAAMVRLLVGTSTTLGFVKAFCILVILILRHLDMCISSLKHDSFKVDRYSSSINVGLERSGGSTGLSCTRIDFSLVNVYVHHLII